MRNLLIPILVLLLLPAMVFGQIAILDTTGTPAGRYYVQVDVASDGSAVVTPIKQIVRLDSKPSPPPGPQPDPVTLTERAKAINAATRQVTGDPNHDKTAIELATMYRELGKKITAGDVKGPELIAAVAKGAADMLLAQRNATTAWQPVRTVITAQWTDLMQQGGTDADFVKLLNEIADGLQHGLQPQAIDIAMIIKILTIILELLKMFPMSYVQLMVPWWV